MENSTLSFDIWQFYKPPSPVAQDTCLSYEDYERMHCDFAHTAFSARRLETPDWAINHKMLQAVLLRFVEGRAYLGAAHHRPGTPAERLKFAIARCSENVRHLRKQLAGLEKHPVKSAGRIKSVLTEIRLADRPHLIALGCVFHYYHMGKDSVETAAALGLSPPHVRQILWRLRRAAARVAAESRWRGPRMTINILRGMALPPPPVVGKKPRAPRICAVCGVSFTPGIRHKKFCSGVCRKKRANELKRKKRAIAERRFFCSAACRAVGKLAPKTLLPSQKSGKGAWKPAEAGTGYKNYKTFCGVVGTEPLSETQWRLTQ